MGVFNVSSIDTSFVEETLKLSFSIENFPCLADDSHLEVQYEFHAQLRYSRVASQEFSTLKLLPDVWGQIYVSKRTIAFARYPVSALFQW